MGIEFEGEVEQEQTESLASRMIADTAAQHEIVQVRVTRVRWTAMESDGWCDDLYLELGNGARISAPRARVEGLPNQFHEALKQENEKQRTPIAPDPARLAGEEIMRGVDPPELKGIDPVEKGES